ncbi:MAG: hypothetical protein V4697_01625 [Patescibacteria group bacterium]
MTLREKAALVSAVLVIVGTIWYIYLALSGKKMKPVLAAWIVNSVATMLSFATYWTAPKHSFVSNAYNATSILTINAILITSLILMRREKKGLSFSSFQKGCLWFSLSITIFWVVLVWGFHCTGIIPNVLTQGMRLIAYYVIAEKLWKATTNTESLFGWWCIVAASLAGTIAAAVSHDWLASLFALSTMIGSLILVLLAHRVEYRSKLAFVR